MMAAVRVDGRGGPWSLGAECQDAGRSAGGTGAWGRGERRAQKGMWRAQGWRDLGKGPRAASAKFRANDEVGAETAHSREESKVFLSARLRS